MIGVGTGTRVRFCFVVFLAVFSCFHALACFATPPGAHALFSSFPCLFALTLFLTLRFPTLSRRVASATRRARAVSLSLALALAAAQPWYTAAPHGVGSVPTACFTQLRHTPPYPRLAVWGGGVVTASSFLPFFYCFPLYSDTVSTVTPRLPTGLV